VPTYRGVRQAGDKILGSLPAIGSGIPALQASSSLRQPRHEAPGPWSVISKSDLGPPLNQHSLLATSSPTISSLRRVLPRSQRLFHNVQTRSQSRFGVGHCRAQGSNSLLWTQLLRLVVGERRKRSLGCSRADNVGNHTQVSPSARLPSIAQQQRRALSIHEYRSADLLRQVSENFPARADLLLIKQGTRRRNIG
jgi:hypothetical protein